MVELNKATCVGGDMELCETILKCISGLFTIYFAIVGLALLAFGAFGAFTIYTIHTQRTLEQEFLALPSLAFVVFGALLLIFVIVGCCAICREVPCCMETYSVLLVLLAVAQIGLGTYLLCTAEDVVKMLTLAARVDDDLQNMLDNYNSNPGPMDQIQEWLTCCGKQGSGDYYSIMYGQLPKSCCEENVSYCTASKAYKDGCKDEVVDITIGTNYYIGWISVIVGITELIGAILGFFVSCTVWRKQTVSWA